MKVIYMVNYIVNRDGSIFSLKSRKKLKPQDNGNGYKKVSFRKNGKTLQKYVHRVVMECFSYSDIPGLEVDHIDRIKSNNNVDNLRWVTPSQNQSEMVGNRYSSPRKCRTYSEEEKYQALKMFNNGWRVVTVSKRLGIPRQTVSTWIKKEGVDFGTCLL